MQDEQDWAVTAGLKEEPKPKKLDKLGKYIPTLTEFASGLFFIALGLLAMRGGGIAIQASPNSELTWVIQNFSLPSIVCWVLVWYGVDEAIFKGKATVFILNKTAIPVFKVILVNIIGEEKLKSVEEKLNRWANKDNEHREVKDGS